MYEPLLAEIDEENEVVKDSIKDEVVHALHSLVTIEIPIPSTGESEAKNDSEKRSHASLFRLFKLLKSEIGTIFVATIALAISTTSQLAQPYFFGRIILVSTSDANSSTRTSELNKYTFILLVILFIGGIAAMLRGWLYTLVGERLVRTVIYYTTFS
jgi:ABC-type bacteriocin/lantibiotic exporter with double-glycine peptidase domain